MAVGIRPNVKLAQEAGLHCDRGIVVNDTLQTFDPRIYAIGECVSHRGSTYGLVAPLFEMAKVCANHLAQMGIGRYVGSQTSTKLKVTGIDLFSAGDFTGGADTEEIVLVRSGERRLQEARAEGRQADRQRALRRHRRRRVVLQAAARRAQRRRDPRPADVRRIESRRHRAIRARCGRCCCRTTPRSAAATACARGRSSRRSRSGTVHAGRRAQAHQGVVVVRLVHRPRRADPDGDRRRRLFGDAEAEAAVRLHRSHAPGGARCDPRAAAPVDPGRDGLPRMAHAQRLRHVPAGAQLLPHLDLAEGSEGRSAVALHQRARARQHPEGRDVLGRPADVGRRNHVVRAAPDRRRRRQVRDPDGEGDGRPADRSPRREEAGPARSVAGPRHAVGPRVRQGAAHGEDVRRLRVVPLRHAGFDADGQGPRARAVANVRAAQGQARGVGLPAQLRRIGHQGRRRDRRRFGLGDLCRGQRRHQDRSRAISGQGEDVRRSARICRRVPAALSRGGLVPRAHRALRVAGRSRLRQEAGARRRRGPARRSGIGCSSRSRANPTRGTSRRAQASIRAQFIPIAPMSAATARPRRRGREIV